jgi:hypothetical protein
LAGALIAAGFGAAALRGFLAGAGSGEISTATGGVVSAAGGSYLYGIGTGSAGTYGIGVVSAGGSNLYGADAVGVATVSGFFPVKNSTIFLNMCVSYAVFITEHILAKKSEGISPIYVRSQHFIIYNST